MENGETLDSPEKAEMVVNEPDESTKQLWDLYALTAGMLQACVENAYPAKHCRTAVLELHKRWTAIYGEQYMKNAMANNVTPIYFTMMRV